MNVHFLESGFDWGPRADKHSLSTLKVKKSDKNNAAAIVIVNMLLQALPSLFISTTPPTFSHKFTKDANKYEPQMIYKFRYANHQVFRKDFNE